MSIREYLEKLNLEQLQLARDTAIGLIAQKEAVPRVLLWQVCDEMVVLEHSPADDYLKAAEFLFKTAKKYEEHPEMKPYQKKLELTFIKVPADEVKDYLGNTV